MPRKLGKSKRKKEYARQKFIKRSGPDWRHGQYTYVISAISVFLYDTNNFLESHKGILDAIYCIVSIFNGSEMYRRGSSVILSNHPAYHELHEDEETSDPRRKKQRTESWLDLRKQALIGSTLYTATGLDGLKKQKEYFDKVICKVEEEKSNQVNKNMEYGTNN